VFGEDVEARAIVFIFFAFGVTLIYEVSRSWPQRSYRERMSAGGRKYIEM
jgi:hypothetical protein